MSPSRIKKRIQFVCRWKKQYTSEQEVIEGIVSLMDKPCYRAKNNSLEAYICPACGYMHIGHAPVWKEKAVATC